jgi:PDZ domain
MELRALQLALTISVSALALNASVALAQSRSGGAQSPPAMLSGAPKKTTPAESDSTLEIAPRVTTPLSEPAVTRAPASESPTPENTGSAGDAAATQPQSSPAARNQRPYLGVSARFVAPNSALAQQAAGLEIISVDNGSPAQQAGLRGRTGPSSIGASGTTAGALLPPLDLMVMPILRKSGQLGNSGDIIVAVDDKRVESQFELSDALDKLKPGDTIYLTVERVASDGSRRTLKIPVKLGRKKSATDATSAANSAQATTPGGNSTTGARSYEPAR